MKSEHVFLFAPLRPTETHDDFDQKSYGNNWARPLPKQHGSTNMILNSTLYRKLSASIWKEKINSKLHREVLNKHTGHTAATAESWYEIATDKERNAAVASHYTELALYSEGPSTSPFGFDTQPPRALETIPEGPEEPP